MSQKRHFRVSGREFALDKDSVERKLATINPQPIDLVYVKVGKKDYPVKQVLAKATGLIKSQFTTQDATRVLGGLGSIQKRRNGKRSSRGWPCSQNLPLAKNGVRNDLAQQDRLPSQCPACSRCSKQKRGASPSVLNANPLRSGQIVPPAALLHLLRQTQQKLSSTRSPRPPPPVHPPSDQLPPEGPSA